MPNLTTAHVVLHAPVGPRNVTEEYQTHPATVWSFPSPDSDGNLKNALLITETGALCSRFM